MSKTILYVDDEPWFIEPLIDTLKEAEYIIELAMNGSEAITILKTMSKSPDLIILDIIMPSGDIVPDTNAGRRTGLKVHEIIRKQLKLTMPIIFLTVVDDPTVEKEIDITERSVGIKNYSYLVKPVLPTELLEKVMSMVDETSDRKR